MKKLVIYSSLSFVIGIVLTGTVSYYLMIKTKEIESAIRIPAEIATSKFYIKILDEEKYNSLREHFVENLRCHIQDYENAMKKNERFSSIESFNKTKEEAHKYTEGKECLRD